jgi:hypothetical protein
MFSIERALIDGLLLSLGLTVIIIGSMIYNARLWLNDYPREIQAKVPPLTQEEKRQRGVLALLFLILMLAIPFLSTRQLRIDNGGTLPFVTAYLHTFVILQVFNLFDAAVIDLGLAFTQPKFMILPGTEAMGYLYRDWGMHFKNFVKGIVICAVGSLLITLVAMLV